MTRKFKTLGLALFAVLAMSAVVAQAAQAVNHKFLLTEVATAELTGTPIKHPDGSGPNHILKAGEATVECEEASFVGMVTETEGEQQSATPTYGKCHIGEVGVEVVNGAEGERCVYTFHGATTKNTAAETGGEAEESAAVDLVCPTGRNIVIKGPGCTITFGNQTVMGAKYSDTGTEPAEKTDVDVTVHAFGIHYSASGLFCGAVGVKTGAQTDGTYLGNTTVRAYKTGKAHTAENQVGFHVITP